MGNTKLGATDLFALRYIRGGSFSPDGSRIAYVVSRTDEEEHFDIFIADADGGNAQRLAYGSNATSPRWSPDGKHLAFVGDGRLRVATFSGSDEFAPLTPEALTLEGAPSWSPDSRHVAVSLLEVKPVNGPRRLTTKHFRADGLGYIHTHDQGIYSVDVSSGATRRLTSDKLICSGAEWSPKGDHIFFFATDETSPSARLSPRLLCMDTDGDAVSEVLSHDWSMGYACWLPDGERIAIAAAREPGLIVPPLSLWVIDRSGKNGSQRTPDLKAGLGFYVEHDMPYWENSYGENSFSLLDGKTAYVTIQKGGCTEVWRIALEGDVAITPVLTGERSCVLLDVNQTAGALLYVTTDLQKPTELCRAALDGSRETRLTHLNDKVIAEWPATEWQHFTFKSYDDTPVDAWFMAPAGSKGPLPTVMYIHGGPYGTTGHAFRYDFHMLASQGYAILIANFRGSTGYGKAFTQGIVGDWGARGYHDHMGAVDAAIGRGLADPARLGVWGHSHGGFATCWIVGHTDRFKAAVAQCPVTNFTTLYYLTDIPHVFEVDLGGKPHEIPDVYRSRSPITYAHRCRTPTMLLHGEDDLRCPMADSEQFFRVLLDVGCPTELFRIANSSHGGDSYGPLSARREQNEGLLDWFGRYL